MTSGLPNKSLGTRGDPAIEAGEMTFHQLSQTGPHRLRYVDLPKTFVMLSSMQAAAWAVKSPIGLSAKLLTAFIRPILPS